MIGLARVLITDLFDKLGDLNLPDDLGLFIFDDVMMRKFQKYGWYAYVRVNGVRYAVCTDIDMECMCHEEVDSFIEDAHKIFKQGLLARQEFRARDKKEIAKLRAALEVLKKDW